MPQQQPPEHDPDLDPVSTRPDYEAINAIGAPGRQYLFPAEIAALFYKLQEPYNLEAARVQRLLLKEMQKSTQMMAMLTGDGVHITGQLPQILHELEDGKRRQVRIMRRVRVLEESRREDTRIRDIQHQENQLAALKREDEQNRKLNRLGREIRMMRRNQLWVIRFARRAYEWATAEDDKGKRSRAKLAALFATLITAEEGARKYLPPLWHRALTYFQNHIRL